MDASAYGSGGRGALTKQTELLGVGYSGRLLNGSASQGGDGGCDDPSATLLRITLLQLQRALTQNVSLSDALRDALSGQERTSVLLRQYKTSVEEAAARNAAAAERIRSHAAAELQAAQKAAAEACSLMKAEVENAERSAAEAKEMADVECARLRNCEESLQEELRRKEEMLIALNLRLGDQQAQQEENQRLAAALAEVEREAVARREALAKLECDLTAARQRLAEEVARREEVERTVELLREEAAQKDRFLESELAEKDLTFQQQLQQKEEVLHAEIFRRDKELAKSVAQHQKAVLELEKKHQEACQRLAQEMQAEAAATVKAVEEQLQKQTSSAQEGLALVAQLQGELTKKDAALLEARKEVEGVRAHSEQQQKAAEEALAAMRAALASKEQELLHLHERKQEELKRQLETKDSHIVEVLQRREEEIKNHTAESKRLHQKLQEARKEIEALRVQQAEAAEEAQRRGSEVEKLHSFRRQMEQKLLQMQIEGRRAVTARAAGTASSLEAPPDARLPHEDVQTPRQPIKQRRKEAQLQVEWADQMHPALPASQESGEKKQAVAHSTPREDIQIGSPKAGSPAAVGTGGTSRCRRPRPSATGSVVVDTPESAQSQPSRNEHSQAEGNSQGSNKTEESMGFAEGAMHTGDQQDADASYSRRHSLRLRKQKPESSPSSVASTTSPPKLLTQSKKK